MDQTNRDDQADRREAVEPADAHPIQYGGWRDWLRSQGAARGNGRPPLPERRPRLAFLFAAVPIFLIGGLLLSGPFLYKADRTLSQIFVTQVPNIGDDPSVPGGTTLPLPDWDKKERINILLIGIDKREGEEYSRTDTIIIASIDPIAKTVGMMSIPRDLKVKIPGYPDNKVNAAYVLGDVDKYPGGAVKLLTRTIYLNFGINVQYFAQVDFRGFEKVVDTFGGVNVDVPYPLRDDRYPTETLGYTGIYFPAGLQHLDGKQALRFARTRHADNDFGRAARQQQVILALRQQALSRDLIAKFFPLLDVLSSSVRTDLTVQQSAALAKLGQGIPRENIKSYSLYDLVSDYTDPADGTDYLVADWTKVRKRVREMIPDVATSTPTPDLGARIAVRNGAQIPGFAARTVDRLKGVGFKSATVDTTAVPEVTARTIIFDYAGKSETAFLLARTLGVPESAVRDASGRQPNGPDILVVLGQDSPDPQQPRPPENPTRRATP